MKPTITALALCAALLAASGCGRAAGEATSLFTGAKGTVTILQANVGEGQNVLSAYERFELGAMTDEMAGKVPAGLFTALPEKFAKELADEDIPNSASGKTLLIRGKVLHYEGPSTVGKVIGSVEFVVARVEFVDKASGRVLAVANCVGRTKTKAIAGPARKAEGLAKAIVQWIDKRFPDEKRLDD